MYVPATVGVPEIVATLDAHTPDTPEGSPVNVAPVAIVVTYVILVIAVLLQIVCASVPEAELKTIVFATTGLTVIEPVFVIMLQPPVNVII